MLLFRSRRPTDVTLGSSIILNRGPVRMFSHTSRWRCWSAPGTMVRSFQMVNGRPRCPTRVWRKKTGPPSSSLMARAATANKGRQHTNSSNPTNRSMVRLTTACQARSDRPADRLWATTVRTQKASGAGNSKESSSAASAPTGASSSSAGACGAGASGAGPAASEMTTADELATAVASGAGARAGSIMTWHGEDSEAGDSAKAAKAAVPLLVAVVNTGPGSAIVGHSAAGCAAAGDARLRTGVHDPGDAPSFDIARSVMLLRRRGGCSVEAVVSESWTNRLDSSRLLNRTQRPDSNMSGPIVACPRSRYVHRILMAGVESMHCNKMSGTGASGTERPRPVVA